MNSSPAVLFIGHEASRSGAPIALLQFMRWFRHAVSARFSCLLVHEGPLEDEFRQLCPVSSLAVNPWRDGKRRRKVLSEMGLNSLGRSLYRRSVMRGQMQNPELIYCNSAASLPALELAVEHGSRVLCHVHELEYCLRTGIGERASSRVLELSDHFIACSQAVKENLVVRHGISPARIDVVHESVVTAAADEVNVEEARRVLRDELALPANALVVGASGTLEWRKGADLFLQLALVLRRLHPHIPICFIWLGGASGSERAKFLHDLTLADLGGHVRLLDPRPDPVRCFSALDLFVLPSREDPYPLVCLEAAACGCPTVCFDRAGGVPEFIENDCGAVVPYLDIKAMAAEVFRFLSDTSLRDRHGRAARQKVRERHDVGVAAPEIWRIMREVMKAGPPARSPGSA